MKNSTRILIGILLILFLMPSAFAKERVVLLPPTGPLMADEEIILSK